VGDVVSGGDGTDTLSISAAANAVTAAGVTSFETLTVSAAATQDMAVFTATSFTTLDSTNTGTTVFTNTPNSVTTLTNTTTAGNITMSRLVDGTASVITVNAQDDVAASDGVTLIATLDIADEETVNLVSGSNAAETLTITTLTAGDLTNLVLSGTANVIVTNAISGSTELATVNASAVSGTAQVHATGATANITATPSVGAFTFTGGGGSDIITGSAAADILLGGGGADIITGAASGDTINGGAGIDTVTGGAGSDTFQITAADAGDLIQDFTGLAGGDILNLASSGTAVATPTVTEVADFSDSGGAGTADNGEVFIVTSRTVLDTSGNAAADLAAISTNGLFRGNDEADANAEVIVIFNADTDGDGGADAIQAFHLHETGGAGNFDTATLMATFSNLASDTDLASDFVAANFVLT
jgi:Ca2+-binding RTX toxin-like protein